MRAMRTTIALLTVAVVAMLAIPAEGAEPAFGNNLSTPLLFPEGYGLTGYPVDTDPGLRVDDAGLVSPTAVEIEGVPMDVYLQATENTWQADWEDRSASKVQGVDVKWGDNLMSHAFTSGRPIRVEVQLWKTLIDPMTSYEMFLVSGKGADEVQGTSGEQIETPTVLAFSPVAKLAIWRVTREGGQRVKKVFAGAVYETFGSEGGGGFVAETTVSGNVSYGYQLNAPAAGWYRLTFKLLPEVGYTLTPEGGEATEYTVVRHTKLTSVLLSEDTEEPLFTPILKDAFTSTLDIKVK